MRYKGLKTYQFERFTDQFFCGGRTGGEMSSVQCFNAIVGLVTGRASGI